MRGQARPKRRWSSSRSEPHEGHATVRVAVRHRGREQPVDQRLHLLLRQRITGANRGMARMRARELLGDVVAFAAAAAGVAHAVEDVLEHLPGMLVLEIGGHPLDHDARRSERRQVPAEPMEPRSRLDHQLELAAREIDQRREQELLRGPALAHHARLRHLVEDALVRRVLIDDHEPAAHRRQDVGAVELPQLRLALGRGARMGRRDRSGERRGGAVAGGRGADDAEPELRRVGRTLPHAVRPARLLLLTAAHHGEGRLEVRERLGADTGDEREHRAVVRETNLALGRVDVDVEIARGNRDPQRGGRKTAVRKQVAVGLSQRLPERGFCTQRPWIRNTWPSRVARACSGSPSSASTRMPSRSPAAATSWDACRAPHNAAARSRRAASRTSASPFADAASSERTGGQSKRSRSSTSSRKPTPG